MRQQYICNNNNNNNNNVEIRSAVCCDVVALKFLRRTEDVSADIEEMETEMQESDSSGAKSAVAPEEAESLKRNDGEIAKKHEDEKFTMSRLLHSRQLRLPLFIAMFLQVIQQLSGINAVMLCQLHLQCSRIELTVVYR